MKSETLQALQESIAVWQRRVDGEIIPFGPCSCPLCEIFNHEDLEEEDTCKGCPVFESTGIQYCEGTPYDAINNAEDFTRIPKEFLERELKFLQSLLPADSQPTIENIL